VLVRVVLWIGFVANPIVGEYGIRNTKFRWRCVVSLAVGLPAHVEQ
jgi:hypothetical protein